MALHLFSLMIVFRLSFAVKPGVIFGGGLDSIEQLDDPTLFGKPFTVACAPETRPRTFEGRGACTPRWKENR